MRVTTKGDRASQFVGQHVNPSSRAFSDTNTILAAYLEALASLLAICSQDITSDHMMQGVYQNYLTLKEVRQEIINDLDKADVTLEAIEARISI